MVTREGDLDGGARRWERTLAGSTVSIRRQKQVIPSGSEDTNTTYRISIPAEAGGIKNVTLRYNDEAEWTADLHSTGVGESDQVLITVPAGTCYERLPISCGDDEILVYLPGPTVEKTCWDAINGDERAAKSLVQMFASPVRLPFVCGVGLDAEKVVSLISALTDADVHAESRLHAYRFALVRGALISPPGFSIDSKQGLETLLEGIAAAGTNGPTTVIDAITHILATSHSSVEETIQLLQRLGYGVDTVLFRDSGRLLCSFLAKDIITENFRAAHGRAMAYNWQTGGNYEQRKGEAESRSYETRAGAWRELLCAAARESIDEFAYVLANALYWSGEVSRSDARTQELLFDASETVAAARDIPKIAARAAFNRELSAGHRLRSQHCSEMAHQHFEHARELASEHPFLPEGRPVYNAGIVRGHALSRDDNHEQAVHILDQTIEELADYDLNPDTRAHWIRHLEAQKRETQAKQTTEYDEQERAAFLEVARDRYETLELERSVHRIERKLRTTQRRASSTTDADVESPDSSETDDAGSSSDSAPQPERDESSDGPSSVSQTKESTSNKVETPSLSTPSTGTAESEDVRRDVAQYPHNDTISPSDSDELGSIDYSAPPDERDADEENNDLDDPYIF